MISFDYINVLVSIVLGLAITNVLTRLALAMQARERVNFYWPPIAWGIWLFFVSVQHWWAEWGFTRSHATPTFVGFFLEVLVPVDIFLLSALALPDREENGKFDLQDWYFRNRRWFFGLIFVLPLLSISEEIVRSGSMHSLANLAFLLAYCVVAAVSYFVTSRRAGEWMTALAMVMTVAYTGLLYLSSP